jgi:hypothetical protein
MNAIFENKELNRKLSLLVVTNSSGTAVKNVAAPERSSVSDHI